MHKIGIRISTARQKAGLNQSQLARALNVSPQSVQAWEAGRNIPRPSKLDKIAAVLQTSIHHLVGDEDFSESMGYQPQCDRRVNAEEDLRKLSHQIRISYEKGVLQIHDILFLEKITVALIERNCSLKVEDFGHT